jgi:hypothetical protein
MGRRAASITPPKSLVGFFLSPSKQSWFSTPHGLLSEPPSALIGVRVAGPSVTLPRFKSLTTAHGAKRTFGKVLSPLSAKQRHRRSMRIGLRCASSQLAADVVHLTPAIWDLPALLVDNDSGPGCSGGSRYGMAGPARAQSPSAFGDAAPRSLLSRVAIRLSR